MAQQFGQRMSGIRLSLARKRGQCSKNGLALAEVDVDLLNEAGVPAQSARPYFSGA